MRNKTLPKQTHYYPMNTLSLKIRVLNVIELDGQSIKSVESFVVSNETDNQDVVQQAEALYKSKAIANGAPKRNFDSEIGFDHYENGNYFIQLVWSE